jgi:hypothetical protein
MSGDKSKVLSGVLVRKYVRMLFSSLLSGFGGSADLDVLLRIIWIDDGHGNFGTGL